MATKKAPIKKPTKKATKKPTPSKRAPKSAASPETVLVLRTCDANLKSHGGFQWPASGPVSCQDWNPKPVCGQGLHGLLWGCGLGSLLDWSESATWQVVEVLAADIVSLDGGEKVKFPRGVVLYVGDRKTATDMIASRKPGVIVGCTATAGDDGTATAGYAGTATAGVRGTATAGDDGTATAGVRGTATAGDDGTATAGARGTATAGVRGTATAGYAGTATAGDDGILNIRWSDGNRYRIATMYVGEDGIEPNTPYKLDGQGKPVKVSK